MKKSLIYLVLVLLSIQLVLAEITIDDFTREKYNIGEKINVKSSISYSEGVVGALKIDLYCDDESLPAYFSLIDLVADEVHDFDLEIPTRERLMGSCNFLVSVEGAVEDFERTSNTFLITDELKANAIVDKLLAEPGDVVVITGSAHKLNGEIVENGGASLTIDGVENLINLESGEFSYNHILPLDIIAGKHEILFKVEDLNGNKGEDFASFKIAAVPTVIGLNVLDSYAPGTTISGDAFISDQSGGVIKGDVVVEVFNPEGGVEYTKNVPTNDIFDVELDGFSVPGTWKIRANGGGLEVVKDFIVEESKTKETWLMGSDLFVKNTGNVDYDSPIEVKLEGASEVVFVKETILKPNQTITFDLNKEVSYAGEYKVTVDSGNAITGSVVLEGRRFSGSSYAGWGALTFVFLFFIYMVVRKGKSFIKTGKKDLKNVAEKGKHILERTHTKDDTIKQEDINHLVSKVKRENPVKSEDDKKGSNDRNMFKIFD